jgi:hypothetical protein
MDASLPADLARPTMPDFPDNLVERVSARYAEPHRRYHTWAHVLACFDARDCITRAALPEVDLALLFHDAIYDPLAKDNEARSAGLLVEEGRRAWLDERLRDCRSRCVERSQGGQEAKRMECSENSVTPPRLVLSLFFSLSLDGTRIAGADWLGPTRPSVRGL